MIGTPAPDFEMDSDQGKVSLAGCKGRTLVLYFYPKDDTPGCTTEANDFRQAIADFQAAGADVIGVSKDSVASHCRFRDKYALPFRLASDPDGSVCTAYGVWTKKVNYGREYMGIERSTFVIDAEGTVRAVWRKVKVSGHVAEVLAAVRGL